VGKANHSLTCFTGTEVLPGQHSHHTGSLCHDCPPKWGTKHFWQNIFLDIGKSFCFVLFLFVSMFFAMGSAGISGWG
jgi:hypothetical protein